MKLSQWAKQQGIHYNTAYRWFYEGRIQNAKQMDTGTILIDTNQPLTQRICIYGRVSNHARKQELHTQIQRCETFCAAKGLAVDKVYKEIASGMNDKRRELWNLLDSNPTIIVVENKDRLTRFGFNYLEKLLNKQGCEMIVMHRDHEDETDLIKDLVAIITSFCCRLYGLRKGQNKAKLIKNLL